jgi:hypothetical protein
MRDRSAILEDVILSSPIRHALTACGCVATVLLAACGSLVATVTPSSSASPAPSAGSTPGTFKGTGFGTAIPAGWEDVTANLSAVAALSGSGTVLMLLLAPDGGHMDTRTAPQPVPDDQLATYLVGAVAHGATVVSSVEPVNIDGASGVLITYGLATPAGPSRTEEMVVNWTGTTYDITLTTAQANFVQDRQALQGVLDGWTWS